MSCRFSRADYLFMGAVLAGTAWVQVLLWPHFTDDAYITLRYAARLLSGHGLTFNDGETVEGFSNPLWLLLIAATTFTTRIEPVIAAKLLGLVCMAGTLVALLRMAISLGLPKLFLLTAGILAATPGIQVYTTLGMEVPLLMLLLCWGVALSLDATRGSLAVAALCFGLAAITRPEGCLYALLWGLALAGWTLAQGVTTQRLHRLALLGLITIAPFALYQIFRFSYYGQWLPNTAIAKLPGMWGNDSLQSEWAPYMVMLLPLLAGAILWRPRADAALRLLWLMCAAVTASTVIFSAYAGADWMAFGRFILPAWPLMLVAALVPLAKKLEPMHNPAGIAAISLLYATFGLLISTPYISNSGFAPMLMRGGDQAAVGQWLAREYAAPLNIGTARLGGVSYFAPQHSFRDFLGLTDQAQALAIRARWPDDSTARISPNNPVIGQKPDLLLLHRAPAITGTPAYTPEEIAVLKPDYICLRQFPQGNWGSMDVWAKTQANRKEESGCRL